jgi:hypothetical protein
MQDAGSEGASLFIEGPHTSAKNQHSWDAGDDAVSAPESANKVKKGSRTTLEGDADANPPNEQHTSETSTNKRSMSVADSTLASNSGAGGSAQTRSRQSRRKASSNQATSREIARTEAAAGETGSIEQAAEAPVPAQAKTKRRSRKKSDQNSAAESTEDTESAVVADDASEAPGHRQVHSLGTQKQTTRSSSTSRTTGSKARKKRDESVSNGQRPPADVEFLPADASSVIPDPAMKTLEVNADAAVTTVAKSRVFNAADEHLDEEPAEQSRVGIQSRTPRSKKATRRSEKSTSRGSSTTFSTDGSAPNSGESTVYGSPGEAGPVAQHVPAEMSDLGTNLSARASENDEDNNDELNASSTDFFGGQADLALDDDIETDFDVAALQDANIADAFDGETPTDSSFAWERDPIERARERAKAAHERMPSELRFRSETSSTEHSFPDESEPVTDFDEYAWYENEPLVAPESPFQKAYQRLIHSHISYKEMDRWSQGGEPPRVLGLLFGPPEPPPIPTPGQRFQVDEGPPLPIPDRPVWKSRDQASSDLNNTDLLTDIGFATSSDEDIEQALEELLQRDARTGGGRFRTQANKKNDIDAFDFDTQGMGFADSAFTEASDARSGESLGIPGSQDDPAWGDFGGPASTTADAETASATDEYEPYRLRFANEAFPDDESTAGPDANEHSESARSPRLGGSGSSARWGPARKRLEDEEEERRRAGNPSPRIADEQRIAGVLTMPETFPAQYELRLLLRNPVPNEAVERILQDVESILRCEVEEDAFWIELVGDMKRVVVRVRVQSASQIDSLYNQLCTHTTIAAMHGDQIDGIIGRDEEFV